MRSVLEPDRTFSSNFAQRANIILGDQRDGPPDAQRHLLRQVHPAVQQLRVRPEHGVRDARARALDGRHGRLLAERDERERHGQRRARRVGDLGWRHRVQHGRGRRSAQLLVPRA